MKYILLLLLISAQQTCEKKLGQGLPVIKATSQRWTGGAAGSGHGTYYRIYLHMNPAEQITFDSLWVNNYRIPVEYKSNESFNDTMVLAAEEFYKGIMLEQQGATDYMSKDSFPIHTEAEGVLGYIFNGNRYYFAIQSFEKRKPIAYQ
jgi:hypothetical protein